MKSEKIKRIIRSGIGYKASHKLMREMSTNVSGHISGATREPIDFLLDIVDPVYLVLLSYHNHRTI